MVADRVVPVPPPFHVYVLPPPAVNVIVIPHVEAPGVGVIVAVGFAFTVTTNDFAFVHPLPSVAVTVYVVLLVGDTLTVTSVPEPAEGLHVYVLPPPAVNNVEPPLHIGFVSAVNVAVGFALTVTSNDIEFVHPLLVTVTVYVVLLVGLLLYVVKAPPLLHV